MNDLRRKFEEIDSKTLLLIDKKYGLLELLDGFAGYVQMCNRDIVELKKVISSELGVEVNPLNNDQKATLRNGGDILNDVRKIIRTGKDMKDKEVLNANFKHQTKSSR